MATLDALPVAGLLVWLLAGALLGTAAVLVGRGGMARSLVLGMAGAIVGGLLATVLGFGGLASLDARALLTSALTALLALLTDALRRTTTHGRTPR